jgi:hypothetical protein
MPDFILFECPLKNCDRNGSAACKEGCQFLLEEEVMLKKVLINGKSESTTST